MTSVVEDALLDLVNAVGGPGALIVLVVVFCAVVYGIILLGEMLIGWVARTAADAVRDEDRS